MIAYFFFLCIGNDILLLASSNSDILITLYSGSEWILDVIVSSGVFTPESDLHRFVCLMQSLGWQVKCSCFKNAVNLLNVYGKL